MKITFETDLKIDGKALHADFAGHFEINHRGEIDEIALDVYEARGMQFVKSGSKYITGALFDLLKPQLEREYEGDIIDALQDMRDSRAADKADLENDAAWADF
jgi:hypothetical protein